MDDMASRPGTGGMSAEAHVPQQPPGGGTPVYRITGIPRSLEQDVASRQSRYLLSMGIRTVCFLAALVSSGWLRWVFLAAAILLPYFSVVFANAGRERATVLPVAVLGRRRRGLGASSRSIERGG